MIGFLSTILFFLPSFALLAENLPPGQTPLEATLREGSMLMSQGKYDEARRKFLEATRQHPESAKAFLFLGTAEIQLRNPAGAETSLHQAVKLDPKSVDALYNLGVLLLEQNRARESVQYFERAAGIAPPTPELSVNLVRARLDAGESQAALNAAEHTSSQFKTSPAVQFALGTMLLGHDLPAQAVAYLKLADQLAPSQPEVLLPLADGCLRLHDLPCATGALERAGDKAANSSRFHFLQGQAAFLDGRQDQALREVEAAIQREPKNVGYLVTLARYYQKYGQQQKAVAIWERAGQLDPHLAEVPYGIAVSYFIAEDYRHAIEFATKAVDLDPSFDRAVFLLGISSLAAGDRAKGEGLVSKAVALQPANAYYHCFQGMVQYAADKLKEAAVSFRESIRLEPAYALPRFQLGRLLVRTQDFSEAIPQLERAIALQANLTEAYFQLNIAYSGTGETEKATQALAVFQKLRTGEKQERREILQEIVNETQQSIQAGR